MSERHPFGKWAAQKNPAGFTLDLYLYDEVTRSAGQPLDIVIERVEPHTPVHPVLRLPPSAGQDLFDALWAEGYRPPGERVTDQTFDAQRQHIAFAERMADELLRRIADQQEKE